MTNQIKSVVIFRLGELFSGPGGLALGAFKNKIVSCSSDYLIQHLWAVDYDSDACETYRRNLCPDCPQSVICEDVRKLQIEALKPIDGFAFGFPCNDFSVVGERLGFKGEFGPLYQYGVKILRYFKPQWFLAENVSGLRSAGSGDEFKKILKDLDESGYHLTAHLFKFEEYGVPQSRHRIIIVGIEKKLRLEFKVPAPTHLAKPVTARKALKCPPIALNTPNHEFTRQSDKVVRRLKFILPGQNAWTAAIPKDLCLHVERARLSHIYKRLDPEKPSYTVTGSGGGGTHIYHWEEARSLTNRERARLQTFSDDFVFYGSKESVRRQIGMAVPPKAARIIFESILKTFAGIDYDSVKANLLPLK
jgi:DNA (cytosine-5)-methyltransferase 1